MGSGAAGQGVSGSMGSGGYATGTMNGRVGGMMSGEGRWWEAFGTGGFEGEPSLMEGTSTSSSFWVSHWMLGVSGK